MFNLVDFIQYKAVGNSGYELVNPFLLIFAVTYGVLHKVDMFRIKAVNIVIAVCAGLLAVIPHVLGTKPDIVPWLNGVLPYFALILVVILSIFIILALFGWRPSVNTIMSIISFVILVDIATPDVLILALLGKYAPFDLPKWLAWTQSGWFLPAVIITLVFAGLVWWITREPD